MEYTVIAPDAIRNIDLFGDGTWYANVFPVDSNGNAGPDFGLVPASNFQDHGSVGSVVPIPAAFWLFITGLTTMFRTVTKRFLLI